LIFGLIMLAFFFMAGSLGLAIAFREVHPPEKKSITLDPGRMNAEEYERLNQMRTGTYQRRGCSIGPGR